MKPQLVFAAILIAFGLSIIFAIQQGYIASSGMGLTLYLLAIWALGSALKIVVESRKKK